MSVSKVAIDGNEAAASVAYRTNEVVAIYPITPASPMGEWADHWAAKGQPNLWGTVPSVIEMQSEAGAAGAVHGALQTGALATTFTASQGLLLMLPNMYKIAGELTPTVFHIAARTLATHALSIFCDHGDVMAARQTGWAMLAAASVQEVADFALISQAATLRSRIPFLHFFDGFRTSHEIQKIELPSDEQISAMIDQQLVHEHRGRALSPEHPVIRGTAQNPDVFFQAREAINPMYDACAGIVAETMERFAQVAGRRYQLFDYYGDPEAERVIVLMGSAVETALEAAESLNRFGARVGVLAVRLYRPFAVRAFIEALPRTVRSIAVLDRTKEPGATGEPLYQDVITALREGASHGWGSFDKPPKVTGGRYGLSSKEFTPAMVKAIYDELGRSAPKNHFTIGITDDVSHTSLEFDPGFSTERDDTFRGVFFGLGSDGTVSANKSSIKIIADETENYAQGYFVYDSKKAGSVTVSHLRFGPRPIHSTYLISAANFVACHQFNLLEKLDILDKAGPGATFLLNSPFAAAEVWDHLPRSVQQEILDKQLKFYVVDASKVAREAGLGTRINTVMQTCFFGLCGVIPKEQAIEQIKAFIKKAYGGRGEVVVQKNFAAVDQALVHMEEVPLPGSASSQFDRPPVVAAEAPDFVQNFTAKLIAGHGDFVPVSALAPDGTFPSDTAQWEKRAIAAEIPVWDPAVCIQCAKCAMVCPHAAIRIKVYDSAALEGAPASFLTSDYTDKDYAELKFKYTIQTAPDDCTGCNLCVHVCPAKNKKETRLKAINMTPIAEIRERERANYKFFLDIPEVDRRKIRVATIKGSQLLEPLFEYSGACSGCGETPYLKLLTQMFGDRLLVANATGCSSIYGGNLPTTPWAKNSEGRGPAWSNSLFEDNAEFGLGFRLTLDKQAQYARELVAKMSSELGETFANDLLSSPQADEADLFEQRQRVAALKRRLTELPCADAANLLSIADALVKKSVWLVGGDGWAYDIGYGGLDHVLASGRNVNILVLDTEVYSNTGGQASKATPRAAVAKFAADGKKSAKKNLGLLAMMYGNVYVAQIAMGASDVQTVKAFAEAEQYDGPSIIIAYSHCIAHGIKMDLGMDQQRAAVRCGYWPLYRYNPELAKEGKNPLQLDSRAPKEKFEQYAYNEMRYRMLAQAKPSEARRLLREAEEDVERGWRFLEHLAAFQPAPAATNGDGPSPAAAPGDSQKSSDTQQSPGAQTSKTPPAEAVGASSAKQQEGQ
jgi:pyruvate-ferredoxin/flavodoxin oxidoreductase